MKVAILFGGESSEHEVSISSADNIIRAIDRQKHQISLVFISQNGRFFAVDEVRAYDDTELLVEVRPWLGQGKLISSDGQTIIAPDVIFPVLHGENSEDGAAAALAQLLHLPVIGSDIYASALCMDKLASKQVLEFNHIKTAKFLTHRIGQPIDPAEIASKLGYPVFVKPARTGSSVGISKVSSQTDLKAALDLAHQYGEVALIEAAVPAAREIEVAVLGNAQPRASRPGEIIPDREFYDYDSKYSKDSTSQAVIPADLPPAVATKIQNLAIKAYQILGCRGLARVDFLLGSDNQIILNEVNTLPGFTNISMYPKLWEKMGLSQTQLIDELIDLATEKVS